MNTFTIQPCGIPFFASTFNDPYVATTALMLDTTLSEQLLLYAQIQRRSTLSIIARKIAMHELQ